MFYPVFLNLKGKRVVIIGGGEVAERKVTSLLETGALITVISPTVTPHLRSLEASGSIAIQQRSYIPDDCKGAFLVISATDDAQVQKEIWADAERNGVLVNTVDEPALCSFIMPAIVRQGDLSIAISTGGKSPALAARLRRQLAAMMGPEYARLLALLGRFRPLIQQRFRDIERRKELQYRIVDSDVLALLQKNDDTAARRRIDEIIDDFDREKVAP